MTNSAVSLRDSAGYLSLRCCHNPGATKISFHHGGGAEVEERFKAKGMESSLISLGLQGLFIRAKGGLSGRVDEGTCGISHILPELTGR